MTTSFAPNPKFWNQVAAKYARKPVDDEDAYQLTLARVKAHLTSSAQVLELGCGTGTTAITVAPFAGSILATDLSSQMISIAREKLKRSAIENASFSVGTLESVDLNGRYFDVVLALNLFHLLPDIDSALQRIHQILGPGGLLISKTPCLGDGSIALRGIVPILRALGKAPHVQFLKKNELATRVASAGFKTIETDLHPANGDKLFVVGRRQ